MGRAEGGNQGGTLARPADRLPSEIGERVEQRHGETVFGRETRSEWVARVTETPLDKVLNPEYN